MTLIGALALLAATLATVGIFGVLAYSVAQHTNEIGIRMAMGATPGDVMGSVLMRRLRYLAARVAIGLGACLLAVGTLKRFLSDIHPADPATLVFVTLLLTATALAASYLPARRAAILDPVRALRREQGPVRGAWPGCRFETATYRAYRLVVRGDWCVGSMMRLPSRWPRLGETFANMWSANVSGRIPLSRVAPALVLTLIGCGLFGPNLPPEIELVAPRGSESYSVGDTVHIEVTARDPDGRVERVLLYVNKELVGEDETPPYTFEWDTSESDRLYNTLVVVARDDEGDFTADTTNIEVVWVYSPPEAIEGGWPTAHLTDVGMSTDHLETFVNRIRGAYQARIHGILILRHGKLVFEKYFDGLSHPTWGEMRTSFDRETLHVLSSVAKSYTTTLLGIAIKEGFIDSVDARVMDFFPELADLDTGRRSEITIGDLATMTAGLDWDEETYPLRDPRNDLTAWLAQARDGYPNLAELILQRAMVAEPGSRFHYGGNCTNVLGEIIHRASGMMLDDFATHYLFEPLGITGSWWWRLSPEFVYASGDVAQRPRDMLKLGQLYLNGGVWEGNRLLPEDWVERSATPFTQISDEWNIAYGEDGYSYGWWSLLDSYGPGAFTASGWGGQWIAVLPAYDMVVALTAGGYWTPALYTPHQIMSLFVLPSIND